MSLYIEEIPLHAITMDKNGRAPDAELESSLARHGLFDPIDVRAREDGGYHLSEGSRRLRAAQHLRWRTIPALVEPAERAGVNGPERELRALLRNLQRVNLRHMHLARQIQRLLDTGEYTQAQIARLIHKSEATISSMLRVLRCPDLVAAVERGELEYGGARAMTALPPEARKKLLSEFWEIQRLTGRPPSVRQVEERVRVEQGKAPIVSVPPEHLAEVVAEMEARGLPVEIQIVRGKRCGMRAIFMLTEDDDLWVRECVSDGRTADQSGAQPCEWAPDCGSEVEEEQDLLSTWKASPVA
jgi:ParB/RepB/Spo0J family partition protein